jgi:hypothetical protein
MFETYRMLGGQREAELLREAQRLHALPPPRFRARLSRALSLARRLTRSLVVNFWSTSHGKDAKLASPWRPKPNR